VFFGGKCLKVFAEEFLELRRRRRRHLIRHTVMVPLQSVSGRWKAFTLLIWDDLPGLFPGTREAARWLPMLARHEELLRAAAPEIRVTSVNRDDAVQRHYAESLEVLRIIRETLGEEPSSVVDVGSGGGFPGLVIAAVLPAVPVTLVEPHGKRAGLLGDIAVALGLDNVTVRRERAEETGRGPLRESFDVATARAVAKLPVLLEYVAPLLKLGGRAFLAKGSAETHVADEASGAAEVLGLKQVTTTPMRPEINEHAAVLVYEKAEATPARFPRRPGIPAKRPL
jgi:16S rRNA (guanine527-N7)-methyltransferase